MSTNASEDDQIQITPTTPTTPTTPKAAKPPINGDAKIRRNGSFGIFKTALVMFRGKDKKTKKSNSKLAGNGNMADIFGSVRPLHLNKGDQLPSPLVSSKSMPELKKLSVMVSEDFTPVEASPVWTSSCGTSRFASASSLPDLVNSYDDEDPDEVFDAITGDEMIDSKADEFIKQFYKQIQIQNTASVHHQRQKTI